MNDYNLLGRLTRDPEMISTKTGKSLCRFSVAYNEKSKDYEYVSYFDCVAWGRTGELINQYYRKGSQILLRGRLRQDRYEDQDGKQRSNVVVNVQEISFMDRKESNQSYGGSQEQPFGADGTSDTKVPF